MSEELLINVTPRETRAAAVEDGVVLEIWVERANRVGLVGNIYRARASRVLPGMQAAFMDIGLERTAFLHASDFHRRSEAAEPGTEESILPIRELINEGDDILVQVQKDPLGSKGARLTTDITVPSRYMVFMPRGRGVGVSNRIEDEAERERLRTIVTEHTPGPVEGGYIVRTAAEGAGLDELRADMLFLRRQWELIAEKAATTRPGELVYEEPPLPIRLLRDLLGTGVHRVKVDEESCFEQMQRFAETFVPELAPAVELHRGERPIFDLYGIEDEIRRALERKVPLKSGGYLIIDQTEAMTTVDVNTGAYVGHRNLEETIFKTNLEAAQTLARQLRLRNLGGIIIIDFIDMEDGLHRQQVMDVLEQALARDHARTQVCDVSALGLVEMTRKRTRESLEHMLCEACPVCEGRGSVRTAETVCYDIFREILRESRQFEFQELLVLASQEVVDLLLDEESQGIAEMEAVVGRPIRLQVETQYTQEQFDVVLI